MPLLWDKLLHQIKIDPLNNITVCCDGIAPPSLGDNVMIDVFMIGNNYTDNIIEPFQVTNYFQL